MNSNCEILSENEQKDIPISIKVESTNEESQVVLKLEESSEPEVKLTKVTKVTKESSKDDLRERIEWSQFIRMSVRSTTLKYNSSCKIIFARRTTMVKLLEPDTKIFKGLNDVEPWDEALLPPLREKCTSKIIASIRKGMLLGKLYNIPKETLKLIYPRLSLVASDRLVQGKGWIKKSLYRCPLCPKDFVRKTAHNYAYNHIEQYHTSSLVTCIKCHLSFTFQSSALRHRANCANCKQSL